MRNIECQWKNKMSYLRQRSMVMEWSTQDKTQDKIHWKPLAVKEKFTLDLEIPKAKFDFFWNRSKIGFSWNFHKVKSFKACQ